MKRLSLAVNLLAAICFFSISAARAETLVMKIDVEDKSRQAIIFAPAVPAGNASKLRTVFAFHGHGGAAPLLAERLKLAELWPEALVVYMQGLPSPGMLGDAGGTQPGWQFRPGQSGDRDLKFFDAVFAELQEKYPVDKEHVYLFGASNGGFFAYLLWAERPNLFAGVAAAACRILPEIKITRPLPLLHFAGKDDMRVLLKEQQETIGAVRKLNGASGEGTKLDENLVRYDSPRGTPVYTYIYGGTHDFPAATGEVAARFFKDLASAKP